ncbi:hypothetical protein [Rhodohalobacter sp. 8-1]|uniref:hypothetical protein n=1 Tax=Rhodohalobacter sp. 8-1 TaxID=3131972 RepID=UPI0030ED22B3
MSSKKKSASSDNSHFWTSLSARNQHLICLGFLFILPFILFYSSTLGGQQYMGHDAIQWRAGAESIIEYNNTHDDIAHWATNMFSGMPATTISHPPQAWNLDTILKKGFRFIYPALEYWVLFGGAYVMLLLLGMRPLIAVFGSVVIGLSTYIPIIIGAGHNAKFIAYIYIPWIYVGYFLITRSRINRWLAFFAFALALTLHLRAYHPQVTYFFLFPLGTLFIVDAVRAYKEDAFATFSKHTGVLLMAAGLATIITLQMYWSTAEYSEYSMRGGSEIENTEGLSQNYAFAWSQGVGELLTLAIPGSYGGASGDAYWGPKSFTSGPHYMGALIVLFFIIGVIRSKHNLKWVFLGPGIATLLFSLGENFLLLNSPMFNYFPLFDKFRAPEMWLMTTVFCFGIVAAMGLEWAAKQIKPAQRKRGKQPGNWKQALMIAGVAGLVFAGIGFAGLSYEKTGERQQIAQQIAQQFQVPVDDPRVSETTERYINNELIPQRKQMARADSLRFALIFAVGIALIWFAGGHVIAPATAIGLLCVLLAADMILVDKRYMNENSLVDGNLSSEGIIERQERELDRFIEANSLHEEGWNYRTLPLLDNPFNNAIPAYFYPSIGGYSGAKLGYYQDLIDGAIFSGPNGINTGVLQMLNVKYISSTAPIQLRGFDTVFSDQQGNVIENLDVLPKAWFVDSVETLNSEPEVLQRISGDFDAGSDAYITTSLDTAPTADTSATVTVTDYGPNRISMDITREQPGFLVLGEIWYPPGWTAMLNGEETDIIRTNYVLRGFEIPAGDHELILTLEPEWYAIGYWLGRVGTIALFGTGIFGLFIYFRKEKK